MSDDFELELRERLARVAAVVPVGRPAAMERVSAGAMAGGSTSRGLRPSGVVPVLALTVAGVVLAGIAWSSRVGPGASASPDRSGGTGADPISATVTDGPFDLTIRASKSRYAVGEPIAIDAVLTYRGQEAVTIFHAQGAPVPGRGSVDGPDTGGTGGPIGFGIIEPVLGDLRLGDNWMESCERTTLRPGEALVVPFAKGGAWSSDHPRALEFRDFVMDPELRLATGTWHPFAVARFALDGCGGELHEPRAQLELVVSPEVPSPTIDPAAPTPETAPDPSGGVVSDIATGGTYQLELRSEKAVYLESDAIDITGAFSYGGNVPIEVQGFKPLVFGVAEPVYGIDLDMATTLECNHETLDPGERIEGPFVKGGGVPTSDPEYDFKLAYLQDPVFRLPRGTWHIRLAGWLYEDDCGTAKTTLSTAIEITVLPDPPPPAGAVTDASSAGGFELSIATDRDAYVAGEAIDPLVRLVNVGHDEAPFLLAASPLWVLWVEEDGGPRGVQPPPRDRGECGPFGYFEKGRAHEYPLSATAAPVSWWSEAETAAYAGGTGSRLVLPAGIWTVRVRSTLYLSTCELSAATDLVAEVTITVMPHTTPRAT